MTTHTDPHAQELARAARIAEHLTAETGDTWLASTPPYRGAYLIRDDGLSLWVANPWRQGETRGTASLNIPEALVPHRLPYSDGPRPEVGVTLDRDPRRVARDLIRRLIPDAEAYQAKLLARKSESDAHEAKLAAVESRLIAAGAARGTGDHTLTVGTYTYPPAAQGEISVRDAYARIKLDVNLDLAEAIVRLIAEWSE